MRSAARPLFVLAMISCAPKPAPATVVPEPAPAPARAPAPAAKTVPPVPADARRTPSGTAYVVTPGPASAQPPDSDDAILVRYELVDAKGDTILRSSPSGEPERIDMTQLPKGWAEAMQAIRPGDRAKIWVTAELGYSEQETGPTGALYVEVELVEVERRTTLARATLPFAAPPDDAIRTRSGLAYVVLRPGTGTTKPGPKTRVVAHYDGWHTDGTKFDSSYDRKEPIEFELHQVIAGWTEMMQLMVTGEIVRVWIPVALAYKGQQGRPAGTLVFDIELLEIR
ncbi:MAG: FKBP-type peptidyl-prolyl cis-trans isomerase [Myxococcales bacterium]|nr:FKBP-type peptidyl-prolyl cis-trans isomerase [Myxococcales bacterium]